MLSQTVCGVFYVLVGNDIIRLRVLYWSGEGNDIFNL